MAAMFFALAIGIPLGLMTAKRRGSWFDQDGTVVALIGISIPIFFLGLMLKWAFAIHLPILPDSGRIDLIDYTIPRVTNFMTIDTLLAGQPGAFLDSLQHLILPAIALGTIPLAIIMRITRASAVDVLNEDYVRTANAKGLPSRVVDNRHVLRNAMLPGDHRHRPSDRPPAGRSDPDRDDLRVGWRRKVDVRRGAQERLPGHPERRPAPRDHLRPRQPRWSTSATPS